MFTCWIGRYAGIGVLHIGEDPPGCGHDPGDQVQVEPHALALATEDTLRGHGQPQVRVELLREQRVGRAHGVAGVHDHHVECVLVVLDELRSILIS